jgi:hypothetical protein
MRFILSAAFIIALVGCPLRDPVPVEPDYPPSPVGADLAERACENLRRLGCSEGHGALGGTPCSVVIQRAAELRGVPVKCWADAETAVAARGCGSLRCLP